MRADKRFNRWTKHDLLSVGESLQDGELAIRLLLKDADTGRPGELFLNDKQAEWLINTLKSNLAARATRKARAAAKGD